MRLTLAASPVELPDPAAIVERFEHVVAKIEAVTGPGQRRGPSIELACPVPVHRRHDKKRSLVVSCGDTCVVLSCHLGCRTEDVLAQVDLTLADLFPRRPRGASSAVVAIYDYLDEAGRLLFQVLRHDPKRFTQRRPDGRGGWTYKLGKTRRPLYRLPQVLAAVAAGTDVWVVDGEKDVHTLEQLGLVATCCPGGAGKWSGDHTAVLAGATVNLVADRKHGQAQAAHQTQALRAAGATVTVHQSPVGNDVSDLLDAGRGLDELVVVDERHLLPRTLPAIWYSHTGVTTFQLRLGAEIAAHGPHGHFPTRKRLADALGCGARWVSENLERLELQLGLLDRHFTFADADDDQYRRRPEAHRGQANGPRPRPRTRSGPPRGRPRSWPSCAPSGRPSGRPAGARPRPGCWPDWSARSPDPTTTTSVHPAPAARTRWVRARPPLHGGPTRIRPSTTTNPQLSAAICLL
jgi:hypothetical protein